MSTKVSIPESVPVPDVINDNNLFPVFLKLQDLSLLIIGGGNVALEKLTSVLNNSPQTKIKLVSIQLCEAIKKIAEQKETIKLIERPYTICDIEEADLIIAAVNNLQTSAQIKSDADEKGKLVNVADKPELCDFYLGSIVQKGSVKIGISTNGKYFFVKW